MSEKLARKFHETYERLAPQFGYSTRKETKEFDPQSSNGKLMIAVCSEIRADLAAEREREEIERLRERERTLNGLIRLVLDDNHAYGHTMPETLNIIESALAKHKEQSDE